MVGSGKIFLLLILFRFCLFQGVLPAQGQYAWDVLGHYGFVWPHDPVLKPLARGPFGFQQIILSRAVDGSRPWHRVYAQARMGMSLTYADMAYPGVLGRSWAWMAHAGFPLYENRFLLIRARQGLGLAWITQVFDPVDNPGNQAIGSHLNIAAQLSFELHGFARSPLRPLLGLSLSHFSNGRTRTPNKGINIPSVKLGLVYEPPVISAPTEPLAYERVWELLTIASGGFSALYPPGSGPFAEWGVNLTANYRWNLKRKTGLGLDVFYSYSDGELLRRGHRDYHDLALLKPGLFVAYQQDFGRLAFLLHGGAYLYALQQAEGLLYNRAGFRYALHDRWILNLTLKTHLFRADFIEWGLGYRFF